MLSFFFLDLRQKYKIYNCSYGKSFAIKDIISETVEASGNKLKILHDLTKPTINTNISLSSELAKNEIGWEPKVSLSDGINKTIQWYKRNIGK